VASSASNLIPSLVAARTLPARDFGAFAVVFNFTLASLIVARAASSEGLLFVRVSRTHRSHEIGALRVAAIAGIASAVGAAALALATAGILRSTFLAAAVTAPIVVLQDHARYRYFARKRPDLALCADLAWVLALAMIVFGPWRPQVTTGPSLMLMWGGAATAGAVPLWGDLRGRYPRAARRFIEEAKHNLVQFPVETLVIVGATTGALAAIALVAGLEATGDVEALRLIFGPFAILSQSAFAAAQVSFAQRADERAMRHWLGRATKVGLTGAAVWVTLFVLPLGLLPLVGADRATALRWLVPVYAAYIVGDLLSAVPRAWLRATSDRHHSVMERVMRGALLITAPTIGGSIGGVNGAVAGLGVAGVVPTLYLYVIVGYGPRNVVRDLDLIEESREIVGVAIRGAFDG
jgi:hypothetical protein